MDDSIIKKGYMVVKRDGRLEPFNIKKLKRAIDWITDDRDFLAKELYKAIKLKIYKKIKIQKLWDIVIETAANLTSEMFPIWDEVAKKAYILKITKETYNLKTDDDFLDYNLVLKKGVSSGVYDATKVNAFSSEEIAELGHYIKKERNQQYTFAGLVNVMNKYAFTYSKTRKLELPQHLYMRLALDAFYMEEDKELRMSLIKERYDYLSTFLVTEASPKVFNGLTEDAQMASCCLTRPDDSALSINETDSNLGILSKYGGGLACDISWLRSSGSAVGKRGGKSSGPVQFTKKFEATISAYDQMSKRKGACNITYPFWHLDIRELIMLKDAGGAEENRARGLMYTIKWYKVVTKRILNNEDLTLFDPKDVSDLNDLWGEEFEKRYNYYENKIGIRKNKIRARDLAFLFAKVRAETGNIYVVFPDNINDQRMGELPVSASNLCNEIYLGTKPAKLGKKEVVYNIQIKKYETHSVDETGELALCNLSAINLMRWIELTPDQKHRIIYNLLRASDNYIEHSYYPVIDGKISNLIRRPIGIGESNYAHLIAHFKLKFDDEKTYKLIHEIQEDLHYYILYNSNKLAQERGPFERFKYTKWAQGILPMDLYVLKNVEGYNFELKHDWDELRAKIKQSGVRFEYHQAIPPTATSSISIGATEAIEPIMHLFSMKEGTYNLPILAPNLKENRQYYELAWDIGNAVLNKHASIRQKFLDQGQSVAHYYRETKSAFDIILDVIDAEDKGLKGLYYLHPMKEGDIEEGCGDACGS